MKRWAALTVLLYLLVLLLLSLPLLALLTLEKSAQTGWSINLTAHDALEVYLHWGFWLWLGVMVSGQVLLLLVPVDVASRRVTARRRLLVPAMTAAFLFANIFSAAVFSVACVILHDKAFDLLDSLGRFVLNEASWNPIAKQVAAGAAGWGFLFGVINVVAFFWVVWAIVFYRFARADKPDALIKRLTCWLLRGSILELLVAVPSHVAVRGRNDCCAPLGTFWGIVTGLSIMILSFGPGVFFLFVARFRRLQPTGVRRSSPVTGLADKPGSLPPV